MYTCVYQIYQKHEAMENIVLLVDINHEHNAMMY